MKLQKVIHFATTDSTFIQARNAWKDLAPDACLLISADRQTAGQGTRNREWVSPPNVNIYATYTYLTSISNDKYLINLPQVAALSVVEVLQGYGLNPSFKWPNDVLLAGKKTCGILSKAEAKMVNNSPYRAILLGIGLNVNMTEQDLPSTRLQQQVTSMKMFTQRDFIKDQVQARLNKTLLANIQRLYQQGFSYFVGKIAAIFETYNGQPQWFDVKDDESNPQIVRGCILGISERGYLQLQIGQEVREFFFGRLLKEDEINRIQAEL